MRRSRTIVARTILATGATTATYFLSHTILLATIPAPNSINPSATSPTLENIPQILPAGKLVCLQMSVKSSRSELCNIDSIDFSHRYPEIYSLHVILKATSLRSTVNRWVRFTSKERHRTRSLKHLPKGQRLTSTNSGCTHRQQHGLKPLYPALQPVVSALAEYKRS